MLNRVMECENRILQDRKMLNSLMEEYQAGNTSEIIRLKMEELQHEVNYMNRQIEVLRKEYSAQVPYQLQQNAEQAMGHRQEMNPRTEIPYQQTTNVNQTAVYRQEPNLRTEIPYQQMPNVNQAVAYRQGQNPRTEMPYPYRQQKKDVEKTIGKSLMGICASILIFVSIILFATLVVPYLTDTMKMVLMFGVSLAFAIVGNVLLTRDRANKWFLSITGCGMGAVYISLLVSLLYFKAMTDVALYVCILVWAVIVSILSRLRSRIFLVIGQIGVLISVIFGVILCGIVEDGNRVLFLVGYFLVAEAVFYVSHMHKEYGENLLNHIFMAICLVIFLFVTNAEYTDGAVAGIIASVLVTILAFIPIGLGIFFFRVEKKDSATFGVLSTIFFLIASVSFGAHFEEFALVLSMMVVVFLIGMERRFPETEEVAKGIYAGKRIFQIALFVFLFIEIMSTDFVWEYTMTAIPAAGCLLYGFMKDRKVYKVTGLIYGLLFMAFPMDGYLYLVWGSILFAILVAVVCRYKEQYRTWMKLVTYPIFLLFVIVNICRMMEDLAMSFEEPQQLCLLTLLAAINIAMMKLPWLRMNLCTGMEEEGVFIETGIIHVVYMVIVLGYISWMEPLGYHFLAILLGLGLYLINIQNLLKKYDCRWSSIYVGTKLFVFFLVILGSFRAPDFLFSITALVFAIAFIAVGFLAEKRIGKNVKAIRIYGLVLSLLSIMKLLLLDIHYDNMLSLALSFFVSGLLCFTISFIYNRVDKRMAQKN